MLIGVALLSCREDSNRGAVESELAVRVVSLAPSITETVFSLGAEDVLVAVTSRCDRPAAAREKPSVGDVTQISLERIAALEPDLVLVNSVTHVEMLKPLASRIDVKFVPTDTVAQMLDGITAVGAAVGQEDAARELRATLETRLEERRAIAPATSPARVLFVVQRDPFFVAGPGSYVDELLAALGYENAARGLGSAWPSISAEALLELAPDVLVDAAIGDENEDPRDYWRRFESLPAVRNGRVRRMESDAVVRPGPGLVEALDALAASIGTEAP